MGKDICGKPLLYENALLTKEQKEEIRKEYEKQKQALNELMNGASDYTHNSHKTFWGKK